MKTVSGREKTAAVERTFRKIFKKEKIDVDEKKKENNAVDTEENIETVRYITHDSYAISVVPPFNRL